MSKSPEEREARLLADVLEDKLYASSNSELTKDEPNTVKERSPVNKTLDFLETDLIRVSDKMNMLNDRLQIYISTDMTKPEDEESKLCSEGSSKLVQRLNGLRISAHEIEDQVQKLLDSVEN